MASFWIRLFNPFGRTIAKLKQIIGDHRHAYGLSSPSLYYWNAVGDLARKEIFTNQRLILHGSSVK